MLALARGAAGAPIGDSFGNVLRWNITESAPQLQYYIDPAAANIATAIRNAASAWSSVPSTYVSLIETNDSAAAEIVFTAPGGTLSTASAAGQAIPELNSDGTLSGCTVEFSDDVVTASNENAWVVVLHETGHCLGLAHSVVSGAIMSYRPGTVLNADDEYAITVLYPKGGVSDYPLGCASVGPRAGAAGRGARIVLWFEVVLFLVAWRFRRAFSKPL